MADVFISYVEEDRTLALGLSDGLEAAGFTTWCYERHSVPGPSYLIQTGQAIELCRAFLIVLSRDALGSWQIDKEVVRAHETGKPFIPVLSGLAHAEFQARRPEWRQAIGGATSILVPPEGVREILPRIVRGLQMLRIEPTPISVAERTTPPAPAAPRPAPPLATEATPASATPRPAVIPWWRSRRSIGLVTALVLSLIVFAAAGIKFFQGQGRPSGGASTTPGVSTPTTPTTTVLPPARVGDEPPAPRPEPTRPRSATKADPSPAPVGECPPGGRWDGVGCTFYRSSQTPPQGDCPGGGRWDGVGCNYYQR